MRSKLVLLSLLFFTTFGFAQKFDVAGVVQDASTGENLAGVSILLKNSKNGTFSDFDGKFLMPNVAQGETIVFSYLGFKTLEFKVVDKASLTIKLVQDTKSLDEVIVLGYSSKAKKDVTGAVSVVSSKTISEVRPIKAEQALQGTVSGVNVTSTSGAPGAGLNIKIRGVGTNGTSDATVLIDGAPGDMSILNPDDIESITVLKDAQAAIYGTLGANGIVIVTTKQGKRNSKTKVSFNSYTGYQESSKKIRLLDATEYALLLNESYANNGQPLPYPNVSGLGRGTNWQNEVFNNAPLVNNDFSVAGGSENIAYTFSGSDLKQQGVVGLDKSQFKRNTARLSLNANLSSKIKLESSFIYTFLKRNSLNEFGLGSVLFNAINTPSTLPVYDDNGAYSLVPSTAGYGIEVINPLAQIDNTFNAYNLKKLNGNVLLSYDVFKNFKLKNRLSFNTTNSQGKAFYKEVSYGGKVFDVTRSSVNQNKINDNDYTYDLLGEYQNTFAEDHKVKFTLGTTVYKQFGSGLYATGYDVPNNSWQYADVSLATGTSLAGVRDVASYEYDQRRLSHFAFLDYSFKGKYLVSGTIRRDLSTKFGPGNRIGIFPSVTGGWIVSDEKFLSENKKINFLKLRMSYGVLGNDQIGNERFRGTIIGNGSGEGVYVFDDALVVGAAVGAIPNPDIKWEEAKKFDIGFDANLFDNKLGIVFDYFDETRSDLLINNVTVSGITGVYAPGSGGPTINGGKVNNKGLELAINYKDKISENFSFNIGYNVTKLSNKVLEVNNDTGYLASGSFKLESLSPTRMQEGHEMGYFWGYQTEGIFQNQAEIDAHASQDALGAGTSPGDIKYKDINGDGVINESDRTDIGSPIADYTMGLNFGFNYKNFDFTVYSYASIGNDKIRNYERSQANLNRLDYVLDRWTGEGTSNSVPRVTAGASNNNVFSDFFVEDASFLRIQNVQLGYTFDSGFIQKVGIAKLRLYATANNLYTFTKYKGFDPAASNGDPITSGIDYGFYPTPRVYTIGLNMNF